MLLDHETSTLGLPRPPAFTWPPCRVGRLTAPILNRLADMELQHGHHARAEYLAALAEQAGVAQ